jgi:hypothetical protein
VLVGQRRQLLERPALAQVGDGDVEAVVDDRVPVRLAVPGLERGGEGLALRLDAEVDVRRGAAECRRGVADSKSSAVTVPPNGMSRCVCGSTQPGSTYLPDASITRSASTSSDSPISEIRSPSTRTSPT